LVGVVDFRTGVDLAGVVLLEAVFAGYPLVWRVIAVKFEDIIIKANQISLESCQNHSDLTHNRLPSKVSPLTHSNL
jgi:hypothetical protein